MWPWLSNTLHPVVLWKLTDVSAMLPASMITIIIIITFLMGTGTTSKRDVKFFSTIHGTTFHKTVVCLITSIRSDVARDLTNVIIAEKLIYFYYLSTRV
jgi:hypothetical protein